ncbi:MAG: hypothetical protein ACRDTV_10170 [Mycobacterium sp.]
MNTSRNTKLLRASAIGAAAVVAMSAMLFAGTGTAQATTPTYFTNPDGTLEVIYGGGGGLALYATIVDASNPPGVTETCHYHAMGVQKTPAFPYDAHTWVTGPNPSSPVTIIFQQWGGTYSVDVTCNGTGNSAGYSPVVY